MKRLIILSGLLNLRGLNKEAADVMKIPTGEMSDEDIAEAEKEFGADPIEEEEYLSKVSPVPDSNILATKEVNAINLLKSKGIVPVVAGDTDIIGKGSFGKVIRVVYKGKPAVAKIAFEINDRRATELNKDVENWKKILALKDQMPEDLRKHLPEVYLLEEDSVKMGRYFGDITENYQLIVMEELYPLSRGLKGIMNKGRHSVSSMGNVLEDFISEFNEFIYHEYNLPSISSARLMKLVSEDAWSSTVTATDIGRVLIEHLVKIYPTINNRQFEDIKRQIFYLLDNDDNLSDMGRMSFPVSGNMQGTFKPTEEFSGLYAMLLWLREHGVTWFDVKPANVMLGRDGNIKIVDVGAFF